MSKSVRFTVILDDGVRKRHRHETTGGKVTIPLKNVLFLSFPRRRESSNSKELWTPACAGVTGILTFYEFIKIGSTTEALF